MANKVKLGPKASSFTHIPSGFTIAPGEVVELPQDIIKSKQVTSALAQGHLVYHTGEDPTPTPPRGKKGGKKVDPKIAELTEKFQKLTPEELVTYLKDNYELTEEALADFASKEKDAQVETLVAYELESE